MRRTILTVTPNPALDKIVNIVDKRAFELFSAGGKGINVSRALKFLGRQSTATGFIGQETGRLLMERLCQEHIQNDFIVTAGRTRVNTTYVINDHKEKRMIEQGDLVFKKEQRFFFERFEGLLRNARWVVISGRSFRGDAGDFFPRCIRLAQKRFGISVTLDTSGDALKQGMKASPFMIKPNLKEAQEFLGMRLDTTANMRAGLFAIHRAGVRFCLISCAARGLIGSNGKEIWEIPAFKERGGHGVGCGDAMVAGFLDAILRKCSFLTSLCRATAAGEANMLNPIPGCLDLAIVNRIQRNMKPKRVA